MYSTVARGTDITCLPPSPPPPPPLPLPVGRLCHSLIGGCCSRRRLGLMNMPNYSTSLNSPLMHILVAVVSLIGSRAACRPQHRRRLKINSVNVCQAKCGNSRQIIPLLVLACLATLLLCLCRCGGPPFNTSSCSMYLFAARAILVRRPTHVINDKTDHKSFI